MTLVFCKRCRNIMIPVTKGRSSRLKCRKCGYAAKTSAKLEIKEEVGAKRGIVLLEKDAAPLPIIDKICTKCENPKAYYWLQQTRSADEPPTQFFRCMKCNYVWREHK